MRKEIDKMNDSSLPKEIVDNLINALVQGDKQAAVIATQQALDQGIIPLSLVQEVIVPTLTEVGKRFEDLDIFLPELMAAGEEGNACIQLIVQTILKRSE